MTDLDPLESLFFAALERAPTERPAFLDDACKDNPALRERVERLLNAQQQAGQFLEAPAQTGTFPPAENEQAPTADYPGRDETVGAILGGKYKLIEEIGEGGMGSVYMALQSEPVKRAVAVKVIKAGMDSKAVLARFEAERQALAMMDHPNIARVLDAGTTETGRPYFVMELVKGVPITQFCDERKLTPRQRLELFVPVCQAIQHAHQKGIIHRDIKPSNVLVAMYDDRPVPKVIDFGVAKAAGQMLTDKTLMTGIGAVVGTPEYMSPEQANLNNLDIDTRSDVYSLGVLLYELLTGSTPVDKKSLGKAALLEVLRIVREVEAPRASARLSSSDILPSISANRGTEPAKLSKLMKGELDWLVLKALEKDRTRRYDTANALSRDIQRYLADELVEARPPSTGYRMKKFVRRHKGQVLAASLVLLALLGGIVGTTLGLLEAKKQEAEAKRQEGIAKDEAEAKGVALEAEKAAKAEAERSGKRAKAVTHFLTKNLLGQADPMENPVGDRLTVRELLDRAAIEINHGDLPPEVEVRLRAVVGKTYSGLSLDHLAEPHLRKALVLSREIDGPTADATIEVTNDLVFVLRSLDKLSEAERITFDLLGRLSGVRESSDEKVLDVKNSLAIIYQDTGRFEEAVNIFRDILTQSDVSSGQESDSALTSALNLVTALRQTNTSEEAEKLVRNRLPSMIVRWNNKPGLFIAYNELGMLLTLRRSYSEAEEYFQKIITEGSAVVGPKSDIVLNARNNLALVLTDLGRHAEAEREYRKVAAIEDELKISDRSKSMTKFNLGLVLIRQDRVSEGLVLIRSARKALAVLVPRSHPDLLHVTGVLADTETAAGNARTAEALSRENLQLALASDVPNAREMANSFRVDLGWALLFQGRTTEAEESFSAAVADFHRENLDGPNLYDAESAFGMALLAQGRYNEAEPYLEAGFRGLIRIVSQIPPRSHYYLYEASERLASLYRIRRQTEAIAKIVDQLKALSLEGTQLPAISLVRCGRVLMIAGAYVESESYLRQALTIQERVEPDSEITAETRLLLGTVLLKEKKVASAEPLMIKGFQKLKTVEARMPELLDRMIELYTSMNKPDEVKKFRELRAKYPKEQAPKPRAKMNK